MGKITHKKRGKIRTPKRKKIQVPESGGDVPREMQKHLTTSSHSENHSINSNRYPHLGFYQFTRNTPLDYLPRNFSVKPYLVQAPRKATRALFIRRSVKKKPKNPT